jgi:hypothetical protein
MNTYVVRHHRSLFKRIIIWIGVDIGVDLVWDSVGYSFTLNDSQQLCTVIEPFLIWTLRVGAPHTRLMKMSGTCTKFEPQIVMDLYICHLCFNSYIGSVWDSEWLFQCSPAVHSTFNSSTVLSLPGWRLLHLCRQVRNFYHMYIAVHRELFYPGALPDGCVCVLVSWPNSILNSVVNSRIAMVMCFTLHAEMMIIGVGISQLGHSTSTWTECWSTTLGRLVRMPGGCGIGPEKMTELAEFFWANQALPVIE